MCNAGEFATATIVVAVVVVAVFVFVVCIISAAASGVTTGTYQIDAQEHFAP